jgi:hypothetical protein
MCRKKHHTPDDCVSMHCALPATGVARARWDKDNPDDQTLPGERWANCAPPHGSPGRGLLQHSLGLNQCLQLALRCSALDHCATREAHGKIIILILHDSK